MRLSWGSDQLETNCVNLDNFRTARRSKHPYRGGTAKDQVVDDYEVIPGNGREMCCSSGEHREHARSLLLRTLQDSWLLAAGSHLHRSNVQLSTSNGNFKKNLLLVSFIFIYIYPCFVCVPMCAPCARLVPSQVRRGLQSLWNWSDRLSDGNQTQVIHKVTTALNC